MAGRQGPPVNCRSKVFNWSECFSQDRVTLRINPSKDRGLVFDFKLPESDLALRSVKIVNGVPELSFDASRNVPTITEEDVATAFRLASENKRPKFFYFLFPPTHPMHETRFFKYHDPPWLRHTGIGELLAETDWSMKCMNVGTKTNEEKNVYKSWAQSSKLRGLSAHYDFPHANEDSSIIMSCDYATVQKDDNEIRFPEEPKMKITDELNPLYSRYITDRYPSIAYYDEPKFLKIQELIKLIVAVEWLYKEKGVRMNEEWMMLHTADSSDAHLKLSVGKEPPSNMIPKPPAFRPPDDDIAFTSRELQIYKAIVHKEMGEQQFGHCDFENTSVVAFKANGNPCPPQKYLNCSVEIHLPNSEEKMQFYSPVMLTPTEFKEKILKLSQTAACQEPTHPIAAVTGGENKKEITAAESSQVEMVRVKVTTTVAADQLFTDEDPNQLIQPENPGVHGAIIPTVESWNELINDWTVPIPCMWAQGERVPSAMGGVTTCDFKVKEEPLRNMPAHKETPWRDDFKKRGHELVVRAEGSDLGVAQKLLQTTCDTVMLLYDVISQANKPLLSLPPGTAPVPANGPLLALPPGTAPVPANGPLLALPSGTTPAQANEPHPAIPMDTTPAKGPPATSKPISSEIEKPTLLEFINFPTASGKVNLAKKIPNYTTFGILLLRDENGDRMEAIEKEFQRNAEDINMRVFRHWVKGVGKRPVSWVTLVSVLQDMELEELAQQVKQAKFNNG